MFEKKYHTLFIGKHFADPGRVQGKSNPVFLGEEALDLSQMDLSQVLQDLVRRKYKNVRIVLSEEVAYVSALYFPCKTKITREMVEKKAEEDIPEDLQQTAWDFQALQYVKMGEDERCVSVQVAVIESDFSNRFRKALQESGLTVEAIFPESYVLAHSVAKEEGITLFVEKNRDLVLLVATKNGLVETTEIKRKGLQPGNIQTFIEFVEKKEANTSGKIIFSHFSEEEVAAFSQEIGEKYQVLLRDYNPLVEAVTLERISGKDETVLNLNTSFFEKKKSWWKKLF